MTHPGSVAIQDVVPLTDLLLRALAELRARWAIRGITQKSRPSTADRELMLRAVVQAHSLTVDEWHQLEKAHDAVLAKAAEGVRVLPLTERSERSTVSRGERASCWCELQDYYFEGFELRPEDLDAF